MAGVHKAASGSARLANFAASPRNPAAARIARAATGPTRHRSSGADPRRKKGRAQAKISTECTRGTTHEEAGTGGARDNGTSLHEALLNGAAPTPVRCGRIRRTTGGSKGAIIQPELIVHMPLGDNTLLLLGETGTRKPQGPEQLRAAWVQPPRRDGPSEDRARVEQRVPDNLDMDNGRQQRGAGKDKVTPRTTGIPTGSPARGLGRPRAEGGMQAQVEPAGPQQLHRPRQVLEVRIEIPHDRHNDIMLGCDLLRDGLKHRRRPPAATRGWQGRSHAACHGDSHQQPSR